jgi:membrane fusion protein, macrolide-specific efflux system
MKPYDPRLPGRRGAAPRGLILSVVLLAAAASVVVAAGCGGSGGTPAASGQAAARSMQVLTTVQRGDLVQSAMGSVKLVVSKGKTTVVATVAKQNAATVAAGQTATVVFFTPRTGAQGGQSGAPFPQSGQSGAPFPQGGQSGAPFPQGGQSGAPMPQAGPSGAPFPQGAPGGFGGALRGRGTPGMVKSVKLNADGSATAIITLKKLPASATAKSIGFASIQTQVLASNVIVIPTAAIKGSGASATVQVLAGGKTSTRAVVVGKQAGAQSEIVSGLAVGENIIWTRSFPSGGFPRGNGSPFPGQGQQGFGGQPSGGQPGGGFQ